MCKFDVSLHQTYTKLTLWSVSFSVSLHQTYTKPTLQFTDFRYVLMIFILISHFCICFVTFLLHLCAVSSFFQVVFLDLQQLMMNNLLIYSLGLESPGFCLGRKVPKKVEIKHSPKIRKVYGGKELNPDSLGRFTLRCLKRVSFEF